jgi:hypothetical protein
MQTSLERDGMVVGTRRKTYTRRSGSRTRVYIERAPNLAFEAERWYALHPLRIAHGRRLPCQAATLGQPWIS